MTSPEDILDFWFSDAVEPFWFRKDAVFDEELRKKFLPVYQKAAAGELDNWKDSAEGTLVLIIVLDQFSRNLFRDSAQAFATDEAARALTYHALEQDYDSALSDAQRVFCYMPLMHSESLADQEKSVELYSALGRESNNDYAIRHRDVITKFGRFPHRNAALGRINTEEEKTYLAQPDAGF